MLTITLPFPPSALMPNRKNGKHWADTHSAKRKAWDDAYMLALQALNQHKGEWPSLQGPVPLTLTFCPPDKRIRDIDGMLSACKHHLDGVATALTINDYQFDPITLRRGEPVKGGAVIVTIGSES
jgi:crossover junction endodeoxyribonuclease RusA